MFLSGFVYKYGTVNHHFPTKYTTIDGIPHFQTHPSFTSTHPIADPIARPTSASKFLFTGPKCLGADGVIGAAAPRKKHATQSHPG